jgi:hypothetical protein
LISKVVKFVNQVAAKWKTSDRIVLKCDLNLAFTPSKPWGASSYEVPKGPPNPRPSPDKHLNHPIKQINRIPGQNYNL